MYTFFLFSLLLKLLSFKRKKHLDVVRKYIFAIFSSSSYKKIACSALDSEDDLNVHVLLRYSNQTYRKSCKNKIKIAIYPVRNDVQSIFCPSNMLKRIIMSYPDLLWQYSN